MLVLSPAKLVPGARRLPLGDRPAWIVELERKLCVVPGSLGVDGSTVDLSAEEYAALPLSVTAVLEQARERERDGDPQGAQKDLEATLAVQPDPVLFEELGHLHMRQRNPTGALPAYDEAIKGAPNRVELRYSRGLVRLELHDRGGARADLDAYLAQRPDDARALLMRATALHALNERDAAIADLRAALAVAPEGSELARQAAKGLEVMGAGN